MPLSNASRRNSRVETNVVAGNPFAYAQARLSARFGARPGEHAWQQLQAITEFGAYLEQARTTGLRPWVVNLSATSSAHEIERLLREHVRETITEVARWLPEIWQDAVRWTRHLIDLPAMEHLLRGEPVLPWMREEDSLRPLASVEPELRREVLLEGECAAFAYREGDSSLREIWFDEWRRRCPRLRGRAAAMLASLSELVHTHVRGFVPAGDQHRRDAKIAWTERRSLQARLEQYFRRAFLQPAAAFAFLLLTALDGERLRGELVTRTLFTPGGQ